jgi:hypothetical protein
MNKHYAISDLHGMYDLWRQISEYCDDSDTIFFLGDSCDRGDAGLRILTELLEDKRVHMLLGNHEEFIIDYFNSHDSSLWLYNGGYSTYEAFEKLSENEQEQLYNKLNHLPYQMTYFNTEGQRILMNHAGHIRDEYNDAEMFLFGHRNPYLWDRRHFYRKWAISEHTYLVHGHTPVQHLRGELNVTNQVYNKPLIDERIVEVTKYSDGHKIDIDLGSFYSGKAALFNLDTLEVEKYFYTPVEEIDG